MMDYSSKDFVDGRVALDVEKQVREKDVAEMLKWSKDLLEISRSIARAAK